jgi:hypothetical protein
MTDGQSEQSRASEEVTEMAALAEVIPHPARFGVVRDPNAVVAVVLADGTVKDLRSGRETKNGQIASGTVSGRDWILWWERRSF